MSKTERKLRLVPKDKALFTVSPWSCVHTQTSSKIEAYVESAGDWETIAEVKDSAGINAEKVTNFIVRAVNAYSQDRSLIAEMAEALEECIACGGKLDFSAEQAAESCIRRAKEML